MDCLFSLLDAKLKNIDFQGITLMNGIANNLRYLTYDNQIVNLADGRGYLDSLCILDRLKVKYEIIQIRDLKTLKDEDEFYAVFVPKSILTNKKINYSVRHLLPFYSAFGVKEINCNRIVLELFGVGRDDERYFEAGLNELENYNKIITTPLNKAVYFVKINCFAAIDDREIILCLKRRCDQFLENRTGINDNTNCLSGPQFYTNFIHAIKKLADRSLTKFDRAEYLKQYIFTASINSGGSAFYRCEFVSALEKNPLIRNTDIKDCLEQLKYCSNGWREICRLMRSYQKEEKRFDQYLYEEIKSIATSVGEQELSAISCLNQQLTNMFY